MFDLQKREFVGEFESGRVGWVQDKLAILANDGGLEVQEPLEQRLQWTRREHKQQIVQIQSDGHNMISASKDGVLKVRQFRFRSGTFRFRSRSRP